MIDEQNPPIKNLLFFPILSFDFIFLNRQDLIMGNTDSKVDFRVAVVQLTSRTQV